MYLAFRVKFLGFSFYTQRGHAKIRIHPKAIAKMKTRVKELTARSNGMGNEERAEKLRRYIIGWVNYFKIADMKKIARDDGRMDEKTNSHDLLETVETSKDKTRDADFTWNPKTQGMGVRKHKKELLENIQ